MKGLEGVECPKCRKTWAGLADSGVCIDCESAAALERKQKEVRVRALVQVFGTKEAADKYQLGAFKPVPGTEQALKAVWNFKEDPRHRGLYLWGKPRRGKTHLAMGLARFLILSGYSCDVTTARELISRFRTKDAEKSEAAMHRLSHVDIIVVDDFGVAKMSEQSIEIFCEIFNRRSANGRNGWIITSNLFLDDVAKKNEEDRLTSRISETCVVAEVAPIKEWGQ